MVRGSKFTLENFSEAIDLLNSRFDHLEELLLKSIKPKEEHKFVGRKELCDLLHVSVPTIVRMERERIIKNLRTGSRAHYEVEEVKKALANQELRPKISKKK
jgi:hypothetical protein